jgi:outer membrane protein assembly factor BamB
MRAAPNSRHRFIACVYLALIWLVAAAMASAQPLQIGMDRAPRAELSPPQVDVVSGPTASRLEQARALAKDANWEDAIEIFQQLSAQESDEVVEVADGRFVSLRAYCHLQLSQMPKEALTVYRRRVDPLAERWYREALAHRNEDVLRRVVDELFCSSWGDDALLVLGELALERSDYAAARRYWEQISPLLRDPAGQPLWLSLRDIDLDAHWPQIEAHWKTRQQPATWIAFPDTELTLADVRARLILASFRAGEFQRAQVELDVFPRFHPDAAGRLGGQEGPYVATLATLLDSAKQWPKEKVDANWLTFAGSQNRVPAIPKLGPVTGPAWAKPVPLSPTIVPRTVRTSRIFGGEFGGGLVERQPNIPVRETQRPLSFFPVAAHGIVYYSDATRMHAVDLQTGRPAITRDGVLHRGDHSGDRRLDIVNHFGGGIWRPDFGISGGVPRHTLAIAEGVLYTRVGRLATSQANLHENDARDRLVGLNVMRDGALAFREQPEDASWSFDGAPVGNGGNLWVAMRRSDVASQAYVACFDAATGNMLWRTKIGAADTTGSGLGYVVTHNLLTLASDRIYFNTNLGLIVALDASSGEICWLHRYERRGDEGTAGRSRSLHADRDPSPCLVHEGLVVAAPSDTPLVFALDADTGQTIWATDKLPDVLHLLGVVRRNLIVSGNRLWALDLYSGKSKFVWPDSEHAGIRGMGRGLVAGDEVFWPTRKEIYVVHGVTGGQSRSPIPLGAVSDSGANLAATSGRLIVAGYDKLMAFGAALPLPPNQRKPKTEPIAMSEGSTARTGRLSDQSKVRN